MCFTTHTQQFLLITKNNKRIWKYIFVFPVAVSLWNQLLIFLFLFCVVQVKTASTWLQCRVSSHWWRDW